MSRNPYLAATRPTSSFTRSSRTSARRNDLSQSNKGLALGRSRSSATLSSLGGHHHMGSYGTSASGYIPSWQRSSSTTRSSDNKSFDPANPSSSSTYRAKDEYTSTSQYQSRERDKIALQKASSSQNLNLIQDADDECDDNPDNVPSRAHEISRRIFL